VSVESWGAVLAEHQADLQASWLAEVAPPLAGRVTRQELERDGRELFGALAAGAAVSGSFSDGAYDELRAVLTELSRSRARQGLTPSETATSVFAVKTAFLRAPGVQPDAAFVALSQFVDELGLFTFEVYVEARERVIGEQSEQLLELSTPVVKLWDGVVAVPLVGTLDSARTQVVMEKLLQSLVDTGSEHAIIDITGVPAVDTQVAQHLLKTILAARLMGAECQISGISPQIAQTIVALGIDFGEIRTRATLADALVHALRSTGADVVRGAGAPARTGR